jgi:peroxiredoxin Q/BCP
METKKAPLFNLPDQTGVNRSLEEFKGSKVILYFYPKDMTPGCTLETIGFQELKAEFEKNNTLVIGISKDSIESHQKFCKKHNLDIILLSDIDAKMVANYDVWKEKSMFGKKYMGISRESFLVDEKGMIMKHWSKVNPLQHPKEILKFIKELQ